MLQVNAQNVKKYQEKGESLQDHYLSREYQNEFISACHSLVKQHILRERRI